MVAARSINGGTWTWMAQRNVDAPATRWAVVGGNGVTNPFMVTEVYVQQGAAWKLGSLSFTRLLTP